MVRRQNVQRPQDLRNNTVVNSLGLLFVSYIPDTELRSQQHRHTNGYRKKNSNKCQRARKGQPNKTKLLDSNSSTTAKHQRNIHGILSTHASKDQAGSLDFHPYEEVRRYPNTPSGVGSEKAKKVAGTFIPSRQ